MNKKMRLIATILAVLVVGGCSGTRNHSDLPKNIADYTEKPYKIGVGDQLNVMVWRNAELSIAVPVRPDGKISVPLVGDVFAADKNTEQLAVELEKALSNYVRTPQVTVIVTAANSAEYLNRVRVTGAVRAPVSVVFRKGMTVLDLVLLAGGVTEFSNENGAKLYRQTDTGLEVHNVYLGDILNKGDVRSNYYLKPSDILTVPESLL